MTAADPRPALLAADVGRSTCRVQLSGCGPDGPRLAPVVEVVSGTSLADRDGPAAVLAALTRAADRAGVRPDAPPRAVVVGATGATQSPPKVAELATALRLRFGGARVAVTSDVVTAHLGALDGQPGVVTIAGTGAVALGVAVDGASRVVDGHGPLLGDAGSGTWIARRAFDAALRHHDGRDGGSAVLATAAIARFGSLDGLAGRLQGGQQPWRDLASFVPDVATAALDGDAIACEVFRAAVTELVATTRAAARTVADAATTPVPATLVGGLAELVDLVREPFAHALAREDATGAGPATDVAFVPPVGGALAGARRVIEHGAGIHEQLVLQLPATQEQADG